MFSDHNLTVPSCEDDRSDCGGAEDPYTESKESEYTGPECPISLRMGRPSSSVNVPSVGSSDLALSFSPLSDQIRIQLSGEPTAIKDESVENSVEDTLNEDG